MRAFAGALLLCLVAFVAHAEDARKPFRIGVLIEAWSTEHPTVEGLKAGLEDLGLEEGRDVAFDIRFTQGRRARPDSPVSDPHRLHSESNRAPRASSPDVWVSMLRRGDASEARAGS